MRSTICYRNCLHTSLFCAIAFFAGKACGQIRILQPRQLALQFARGTIKGSTAAFGTPYWGERLVGRLAYGESKSGGHCNSTDYELPPLDVSSLEDADRHAFARVVVVRRGVCHFVTKVRVAQDFKDAAAVIVVDEPPASYPSEMSNQSALATEGTPAADAAAVRSVIMADDGRGRSVRIPSILISEREGETLIRSVRAGEDVIVELFWDVPNETVVHVHCWMSPALSASVKFLAQFAPYARIFKHNIHFTPHYWIFSLPQDYNSLCLSSDGAYCAMVPDWTGSNITGKEIVEESVRQTCLWHTTASSDLGGDSSNRCDGSNPRNERCDPNDTSSFGSYSEAWWTYVEKISDRCLRPAAQMTTRQHPAGGGRGDAAAAALRTAASLTEECSFGLMEELAVATDAVRNCLETSAKTFLSMDVENHAWSPTALMINNVRFSGPLDAFVVARAICTGYSKEPDLCTKLRRHHIQDYRVGDHVAPSGWILGETYAKGGGGGGGVAWWVYLLTILGCLTLAVAVIFVYRHLLVKHLRNQLRYEVFEEVKSQMNGARATQEGVLPHTRDATAPAPTASSLPVAFSIEPQPSPPLRR